MENTAQSEQAAEPSQTADAVVESSEDGAVDSNQSFNIFTPAEESSSAESSESKDASSEPRKSKQFLDNLKRDRDIRQQEISLKRKAQELGAKEDQLKAMMEAKEQLKSNPEEFFRSQGIDPMEYYREWTERMINTNGEPSFDTQLASTQKELQELRSKIQTKEESEQEAVHNQKREAIYSGLCSDVEQFASSAEGYETIKDTCTAKDIVNGMVTHYQQTGEELTIEEAFEKIETGLRQREEKYYSDPKILEKLQRYNPEAFKTVKSPQATLSAKWKEQPTRKAPDEMSDEEIMDHWKGKLFT